MEYAETFAITYAAYNVAYRTHDWRHTSRAAWKSGDEMSLHEERGREAVATFDPAWAPINAQPDASAARVEAT